MYRKEINDLQHIIDTDKQKMDPDIVIPLIRTALNVINEQEKKIEELEERVAIMSEDQYKSSEIRFP